MPGKLPRHKPGGQGSDLPTHQRPRESAHARGYGRHWQKIRGSFLKRHPLCVACEAKGRTTAAEHVDHIVPLAAGGSNQWSNLQPLCASCHARKTATEDGGFGNATRRPPRTR